MFFRLLKCLLLIGIHFTQQSNAQGGTIPTLSLTIDDYSVPLPSNDSVPSYVTHIGRSVVFRCSGIHRVTIIFPSNGVPDHVRFGTPSIVDGTNGSLYVQTVTVNAESGYDTGNVDCFYTQSESESVGLYIYVADPNRLRLRVSLDPIFGLTGFSGQSAVIPCRPTSPNVSVELFRPGGSHSERVTYDPMVGFTISNLGVADFGSFECIYEEMYNPGGQEKETFFLVVQSATAPFPPLMEARLTGSVDRRTNFHVGQNISILCSYSYDGSHLNLDFTDPDWVLPTSRWEESPSFFQQAAGSVSSGVRYRWLNITNVQVSDMNSMFTCSSIRGDFVVPRVFSIIIYAEAFFNPLGIGDEVVQENNTFVLNGRFEAVGVGPFTYYWTFGGNRVCEDDKTKTGFEEYKCEVFPPSVGEIVYDVELSAIGNRNHHGLYTLTGIFGHMARNLEATVTINHIPDVAGPFPVRFVDGVFNKYGIILTAGRRFSLGCQLESRPAGVVSWAWHPCETALCEPPTDGSTGWVDINGNSTGASGASLPNSPTITLEKVANEGRITGRAESNGFYRCTGTNANGRSSNTSRVLITEFGKFFGFDPATTRGSFYGGEPLSIACVGQRYIHTTPTLFVAHNGSGRVPVSNQYLSEEVTNHSVVTRVTLQSAVVGVYAYDCSAEENQGDRRFNEEAVITVREIVKPEIISQRLLDTNTTDQGLSANFTCLVSGDPRPSITWYKDGHTLPKSAVVVLSQANTVLSIYRLRPEDSGNYTCVASSPYGNSSRTASLVVEELTRPAAQLAALPEFAVVLISITVAVLLLLAIFMGVCYVRRMRRKLPALLVPLPSKNDLNPDIPLDEQTDFLPYDVEWEFSRAKLHLGTMLGKGAFGIVYKGEAYGIEEGVGCTTVAVKTVKNGFDFEHIKALISELKILIHIGQHLNIVNLLGACTKNLHKGELHVIVEYCRYGNIRSYLLKHQAHFLRQVGVAGAEASKLSDDSGGMLGGQGMPMRSSVAGIKLGARTASMADGAGGEEDNYLTTGATEHGEENPLTARDLVCWCFQVARGMEYLASINCIHRDLAARNILLSEDNVVKICDFGLAKDVYKYQEYKKKTDGPLPIKWMALESLTHNVYNTATDVWSFGVTMWEIFSMAGTPYPGVPLDETFIDKLTDGYRMDKPLHADEGIYSIMLRCWHPMADSRPNFSELTSSLGDMLQESVKNHYLRLKPYRRLRKNIDGRGHGHSLSSEAQQQTQHPPPDLVLNGAAAPLALPLTMSQLAKANSSDGGSSGEYTHVVGDLNDPSIGPDGYYNTSSKKAPVYINTKAEGLKKWFPSRENIGEEEEKMPLTVHMDSDSSDEEIIGRPVLPAAHQVVKAPPPASDSPISNGAGMMGMGVPRGQAPGPPTNGGLDWGHQQYNDLVPPGYNYVVKDDSSVTTAGSLGSGGQKSNQTYETAI